MKGISFHKEILTYLFIYLFILPKWLLAHYFTVTGGMRLEFILYLILFRVVPVLRPWKEINSVTGGQHQRRAGEQVNRKA